MKFKVGDIVQINNPSLSLLFLKETGKVIGIDEELYLIVEVSYNRVLFVHETNLELYDSSLEEQKKLMLKEVFKTKKKKQLNSDEIILEKLRQIK